MPLLNITRYAEGIRRIFSAKGVDALSFEPHVTPCATVEDFTKVEYRAQVSLDSWCRQISIAGVAAQQPVLNLVVPTSPHPDRVFVVEGVAIFSTLASDFTIGFSAADGAFGVDSALSSRQNNLHGLGAYIRNGALAAPAAATGLRVSLPALGFAVFGPPFFPFSQESLTGENIFKIVGVALNNAVNYTICGYTRSLAESEL